MRKWIVALSVALLALPGTSASAAPDDTLGMALMSANVEANGQLLAGSGVVSVTPNAIGLGTYYIKFNRSVAGCTCASMHVGTSSSDATINVTGICPAGVGLDTVYVRTWKGSNNTASAEPFHLIVFCPK